MAHLAIVGWILLGYLVVATLCICCRELLAALCDACFMEVKPPREGAVDLRELKRLWGAPDDGMDMTVTFDSEGGFLQKLARPDAERTARG